MIMEKTSVSIEYEKISAHYRKKTNKKQMKNGHKNKWKYTQNDEIG